MKPREDWEKSLELQRRKMVTTDSYRKRRQYLERLADDRGFQRKVLDYRKKYGIPETGLSENGRLPDQLLTKEAMLDVQDFASTLGLDVLWAEFISNYIAYDDFDVYIPHDYPAEIIDLNEIVNGPFENGKKRRGCYV